MELEMIKIHLLELVQYCQHQHGQILSSNLPETNMILKWLLRLNEIVCNHQMFALCISSNIALDYGALYNV